MKCEIGILGLGVMGRNFLLNIADHNFNVTGYDLDAGKVEELRKETKNPKIQCANNSKEFISQLRRPRAVLLLIPAGKPVDSAVKELIPLLDMGDIIIDAGNSYYKDTDIRALNLAKLGIQFFGVGVSGGEEGARLGPSIMPGGPRDSYESIRPIFEACAARVNNEPCAAYLGPGSSGHFVKMVHNGIEYGIMQLISETYAIMKQGLGLSDAELHSVYAGWNKQEMNSYLIEITEQIFTREDEKTGKLLIDEILDVAKQKGTGMWTSQSAMEMQVPIPTIDIAVATRNLSMLEQVRAEAGRMMPRTIQPYKGDRQGFIHLLGKALYLGMITTYAQGLSLLAVASGKLNYHLDLYTIARIWRGGCIIRAQLLEDICAAFQKKPTLSNLLLDPELSKKVLENESHLRKAVCTAVEIGISIPGLMTSLSYLDGFRSPWLPANLIQAQRDYFGAHTYERIDEKGTFHTEWEKTKIYEIK